LALTDTHQSSNQRLRAEEEDRLMASGKPPAMIFSMYSFRVVGDVGDAATAAVASTRREVRRFSSAPEISPWESGQMVRECSLPVSA
jgi:hypothetical protein